MSGNTLVKRIVCLANSRKLSGRCLAGLEWDGSSFGGWIRPVSGREFGELSDAERRYESGEDPRLLDIIDVPILKPLPHLHQTENWLIDSNRRWKRVGVLARELLAAANASLWQNGYHTRNGKNDQIPELLLKTIKESLQLIEVEQLEYRVFAPGASFGDPKRRVLGCFKHRGIPYAFWVTDPEQERKYLGRPDGLYRTGRSLLTISLGEPYNCHSQKLIAAVIEGKH